MMWKTPSTVSKPIDGKVPAPVNEPHLSPFAFAIKFASLAQCDANADSSILPNCTSIDSGMTTWIAIRAGVGSPKTISIEPFKHTAFHTQTRRD